MVSSLVSGIQRNGDPVHRSCDSRIVLKKYLILFLKTKTRLEEKKKEQSQTKEKKKETWSIEKKEMIVPLKIGKI
jgi:hypothetical protein